MKKGNIGGLLWIAIFFLFMNGNFLEGLFSTVSNQVEYDYNMDTTGYQVDIKIGEDSSYQVQETIDVNFRTQRHGIYRYVPITGASSVPSKGVISDVKTNVPVDLYEENGNQVMQLGSGDSYVYGPATYVIQYTFTPYFQTDDFTEIYYNIFPQQWQNDIPQGSSFSIEFPKTVDMEQLRFYYGAYGKTNDGTSIVELSQDGNTISGSLTDSLSFGQGLTLWGDMGEGYFTGVHTIINMTPLLIIAALLVLGIIVILFFLLGRDEQMITSIQYQPPDDLDSAAVGYIVDGVVEDRDVISLIIYWADKGYLTISEDENNKLSFTKKKDLPQDTPKYQRIMFKHLFEHTDFVRLDSLEYKFATTIKLVKDQIRLVFTKEKGLYTPSSKAARALSMILCGLPFGFFVLVNSVLSYSSTMRNVMNVLVVIFFYVGVAVFCHGIDTWHGKASGSRRTLVISGLGVCFASIAFYGGSYFARVRNGQVFNFLPALVVVMAATLVMAVFTGFMRKRTSQCMEWMGRLVGLRDFIETAELERMQAMAKDNPQWFYHIIPYAYVFGLSDLFAKKLQGLALDPPEWYYTTRGYGGPSYFDYYIFHRALMGNMTNISRTLTVPEPPKVSNTGSGFGGGGFGGGGFGGGGFSGGGFGGGGGGSW